ncbi:MAG: ferredoxin [Parasporobacterium sp.]|nr:ferredoxin [Parasporobacterium sp.]
MKIIIESYCIDCGKCVFLYPELFGYNEKKKVVVIKEPDTRALQKAAGYAQVECPACAITLKR